MERKEILTGCERLYHFFLDDLDKIEEFKGQNFLDTKFATIKISEDTNRISRMYHCEKVSKWCGEILAQKLLSDIDHKHEKDIEKYKFSLQNMSTEFATLLDHSVEV